MREKHILQNITAIYPNIARHNISTINKDIFKYFSLFSENNVFLLTALIQNSFGKNSNLKNIEKFFDIKVAKSMLILNQLHNFEQKFLYNMNGYKELVILFLITNGFLLKNIHKFPEIKDGNFQKKMRYSFALLERLDVGRIKDEFGDLFFAQIEPKIYKNYSSLLKYSRLTFINNEKKMKNVFTQILYKNNIIGEVKFRFKSIYSIHKKIVTKNILFSQVLDIIGLRVIVDKEKDCYRIMEIILTKWSTLNTKIKDYIAVPKQNGYKSIHLTVLVDNHPVEIQIRTKSMHYQAQYGRAAHLSYKIN